MAWCLCVSESLPRNTKPLPTPYPFCYSHIDLLLLSQAAILFSGLCMILTPSIWELFQVLQFSFKRSPISRKLSPSFVLDSTVCLLACLQKQNLLMQKVGIPGLDSRQRQRNTSMLPTLKDASEEKQISTETDQNLRVHETAT